MKNIHVLTRYNSPKCAGKLFAESFQENYPKHNITWSTVHGFKAANNPNPDAIIRYGTLETPTRVGLKQALSDVSVNGLLLNRSTTIANSVNRETTRDIVRYADIKGVNTIPTYHSLVGISPEITPEVFPDGLYGRSIEGTHAGRGLTFYPTLEDAKQNYVADALKYTPKIIGDEFRMFIVNEKVVAIAQKKRVRTKEGLRARGMKPEVNPHIRSYMNGWIFAKTLSISSDLLEDAQFVSEEIAKSLSLGFGAVDLIINQETGEITFLETGTSLALKSPTTLKAMQKAVLKTIKENTTP